MSINRVKMDDWLPVHLKGKLFLVNLSDLLAKWLTENVWNRSLSLYSLSVFLDLVIIHLESKIDFHNWLHENLSSCVETECPTCLLFYLTLHKNITL